MGSGRWHTLDIGLGPRGDRDLFVVIFSCRLHFNVRGVLGNKCAGRHNLKTRHFKETITVFQVIFSHGHQQLASSDFILRKR